MEENELSMYQILQRMSILHTTPINNLFLESFSGAKRLLKPLYNYLKFLQKFSGWRFIYCAIRKATTSISKITQKMYKCKEQYSAICSAHGNVIVPFQCTTSQSLSLSRRLEIILRSLCGSVMITIYICVTFKIC